MNLQEFADRVNETLRIAKLRHKDPTEIKVGIYVKAVGTVGPLPTVPIKHIGLGIDWDSDKCLITPEKDLREIDRDEFAAIQKKFNDMGWAYYEATKSLKKKD